MTSYVVFALGAMVGCLVGVVLMGVLQAAAQADQAADYRLADEAERRLNDEVWR